MEVSPPPLPPHTPESFHSDILAYIGHLNQDKKFYEDTVVSNLCKFVENKHKEQIKNYALDFPRIWTVLLMQPCQ